MIQLMSLNNRKYYIPGETSEKAKLRQQAMELGILIIMINVQLTSSNESLKQYINEEFFDRIEESDIDYHFMNNHKHYDKLSDIFQESDQKQKVDEALHARVTLLKESRERELKYQNERRKEQEQREIQQKVDNENALQERRILAEQRMQERIRDLTR
jgi:transcriptional regulator of acetoin/glycerol metabolism